MINMHDGKTLCTLLPSYNVGVYSTKPPEGHRRETVSTFLSYRKVQTIEK